LYERPWFEELSESLGCFYCGDLAGERDHCPPLSWVESRRLSDWKRDGVRFVVVPACGHCNNLLGDRPLFTLVERAEFIERRLETLYEREAALWSEEEIAEMSPEFQRTLRARKRALVLLMDRVRTAQWRCMRVRCEG
jgi:hypothetical protein